MKILLTNDDGYYSSGLQILCCELSRIGHDVYVVAPDGQRSGFAHAMNYNKPLIFKRLAFYCGARKAYICSGTPADCVRIAVLKLGIKFDLLITGPNNGANFGRSILCSGTVGAAEEGTLCGVKSIALSRLERGGGFYSAVKYVADNLDSLASAVAPNVLLNINVPNLSADKILGVRVCPQSVTLPSFTDGCETAEDGTVKIVGRRNPVSEEDTDVAIASKGYITITPLRITRTDDDQMSLLGRLQR